MRTTWRGLVVAGVMASGIVAPPARAQFAVFDPTNYAENVLHYLRALDQIRAAQAQIQNQVIALKKLEHPTWRDLSGVVTGLDARMAGSGEIGYAGSNPAAALAATFPGARPAASYPSAERAQVARTMGTLAAVLDVAHGQGATFEPAVRQVDTFKQQTGSVEGHEQALELSHSVGVFSAEELVLLRQALASQTTMQAVYYAQQVNAGAQAEENARAVYAAMARAAGRRAPVSLRIGL